MKKLKTFLCSALTVVSLLSLTACGDKTQNSTNPDQTSQQPTVSIQETTEMTIPEDKIAIDAFADFEIKFEGISPMVEVKMTNELQIENANIRFSIKDRKTVYKNGDIVTIEAFIAGNDGEYVLKEASKDFTVLVDSYFVASADDITSENMIAMRNKADSVMDEYMSYWKDSKRYIVSGYELADCEFVMINDGWTSERPNRLIFYYKVNATDKDGNDKSSYYYVYLYNIIQNADGTQIVNIDDCGYYDTYGYDVMWPDFESLQAERIGGNYEAYTITKVELN